MILKNIRGDELNDKQYCGEKPFYFSDNQNRKKNIRGCLKTPHENRG